MAGLKAKHSPLAAQHFDASPFSHKEVRTRLSAIGPVAVQRDRRIECLQDPNFHES